MVPADSVVSSSNISWGKNLKRHNLPLRDHTASHLYA